MHRVTPTSGPAGTGAGRRVTPGSPRGGAGRSHRVVSPACRPGHGSARTPAAAWCVSARTPAAAWLARHLLGLLVLALAACGAPADDAPSGDATEGRLATVTRVVDGDTIQVELDGDELRVRLLNIDAPEKDGPYTEAECLGQTSGDHLASLLPVGTEVRLVEDQETQDQYGRYLAGVYLDDVLVNAQMAREGLAEPVLFEPNDRFYAEVVAAGEEARTAGRGLFDPADICRP